MPLILFKYRASHRGQSRESTHEKGCTLTIVAFAPWLSKGGVFSKAEAPKRAICQSEAKRGKAKQSEDTDFRITLIYKVLTRECCKVAS